MSASIFYLYLLSEELNETQRDLQELARKFSREEVAPAAPKYDQNMEFPWDIIKKLWHLGILNPLVPEKFGGTGLGCLESCIIAEEVAWGCSGILTAAFGNSLAVS